ncbi:translocation/assembly module TamB domain-containing protein [Marinobacter fonticola]|uniref:translocation/assembly module TamB domain-containing protein n=1 Tax=Marinobacter fonticola TaxID=2603215 RepID=UPI0011E89072|nr:translocation/assembly module TamB domain-containing protein [Marinobacter fonticola]
MKRVLLWILGSLVALVLLVVLGLYLLLRSETGTAWLIDQVPGLTVEAGQGSVLDRWAAQSLRWQGFGVIAEIDELVFEWSPQCLFQGRLCIDKLLAEKIDITLAPASEETTEDEPFQLPDVNLPVGLSVGEVRLGPLSVDDSEVWQSLTLSVEASGAAWNVATLDLATETVDVAAQGRLETRGDWPLNLDVEVGLPAPEGELNLDLNLAGSARDLRLKGTSSGYLDARLSAEAQPFEPGIPAEVQLSSERFVPLASLPETLVLNQWTLELDGNLEDGFKLNTQASLPGTAGPVALDLRGRVYTDRARNIRLRLTGPDHTGASPQAVELAGQVQWLETLAAEGQLTLNRFPWYSLLPEMSAPPVQLQTLSADFNYDNERYSAHLEGQAEGPAGPTDFGLDAEGDMAQVTVSNVAVNTGAGGVNGKATIDFADVLAWDGAFQLNQFDPGYWVPALQGALNGRISSVGSLPPSGPELTGDWALTGEWQGNPLETEGHVEGAESAWVLKPFNLSVGENQITASGRWADQLQADFELAMPKLDQLWPGLVGRLNGKGAVSGTLEAPAGQLNLTGTDVAWQDFMLSQLQLEASVEEGERLDANLSTRGVRAGEQVIGEIDVALNGTRGSHRLSLDLDNPEVQFQAALEGGLGDIWSGVLASAQVQSAGQSWALDDPASLDYTGAGRLTLGAHCWRWEASSLCAEDQVLLPTQQISYRLDSFPVDALAALWPENFRWQAKIDGSIDLTLDESGPNGRITLDAGPGQVAILQQEDWQRIDYDVLSAEIGLKPNDATLALDFQGGQLGRLDVDLALDPTDDDRTLQGTYALSGLNLAVVEPFAGLESISGTISGEGELSGPLLNPEVYGVVRLNNGQVLDAAIPMPLEDIDVEVKLNGRQANIAGTVRPNDRSQATLDGQVDWSTQTPSFALQLKGERLPLLYEPYAQLEMSPNLSLSLKDQQLTVSGRIEVPRGRIEVRELPPQAVSVSDDEVIVGTEQEVASGPQLSMDVTVVVGQDEVTFEGFGVTGDLKGELRIGNNLDTRGALQLVDGTYEAYGQELEIRRARLLFVGPISQPYIDIEAVRSVDNVVAGIRLSGPAAEPEAEVFSEPSMPQQEALSYVILGRPLRSSGDQGQVGQAALSLGLARTNDLTRGIGEEFGIKDLRLEAEGSGEDASVVASGYITDDLSVRYGVGVFDPITTVALRYDLGRYFYLEAASGLAASLDLFYTRDF